MNIPRGSGYLALESEKITLSRGAEILGHDLIKMREITKDWAASGEK